MANISRLLLMIRYNIPITHVYMWFMPVPSATYPVTHWLLTRIKIVISWELVRLWVILFTLIAWVNCLPTVVRHNKYMQRPNLFSGIPSYIKYRGLCGLSVANNFRSLEDFTPDIKTALAEVYDDVNDIDLFTGGLSETWVVGVWVENFV